MTIYRQARREAERRRSTEDDERARPTWLLSSAQLSSAQSDKDYFPLDVELMFMPMISLAPIIPAIQCLLFVATPVVSHVTGQLQCSIVVPPAAIFTEQNEYILASIRNISLHSSLRTLQRDDPKVCKIQWRVDIQLAWLRICQDYWNVFRQLVSVAYSSQYSSHIYK